MSDDGINNKAKAKLARMDDLVMNDLFAISDDELLAEAMEDGIDVAAVGATGREAFERAVLAAGKVKLQRIREEMASDAKRRVVPINAKAARSELQGILSRNRDAASKLTMAARNQSGEVEDDDGILEDFIELGAIKRTENDENSG
ncbi:hypothetical protein [Bradyrhizobium sp. RP6]|uniref:hypothetical protein n=1 Tax=Bradyrhizobium sp. RP6 TaxID=2489596 RepID=UPI000F53B1A6|nr:hypothetical protein [Bradyrhizobium sp. RP6]RQH12689.1 hypothetical protein EHH60_14450 [Bradyrhizobium sp. RP6]